MNKTQKAKDAKTALGPRFWLVLSGLIVVAAFLILRSPPPDAILKLPQHTINLSIASTRPQQELGLGNRSSLPKDEGMLFVFSDEAIRCFWMKDMRFSLDILWLNQAKQVVHVESDLSPQTYPRSYCPSTPARYVIELNAFEASQFRIENGQQLNF